jgi:hypothetical protein
MSRQPLLIHPMLSWTIFMISVEASLVVFAAVTASSTLLFLTAVLALRSSSFLTIEIC